MEMFIFSSRTLKKKKMTLKYLQPAVRDIISACTYTAFCFLYTNPSEWLFPGSSISWEYWPVRFS